VSFPSPVSTTLPPWIATVLAGDPQPQCPTDDPHDVALLDADAGHTAADVVIVQNGVCFVSLYRDPDGTLLPLFLTSSVQALLSESPIMIPLDTGKQPHSESWEYVAAFRGDVGRVILRDRGFNSFTPVRQVLVDSGGALATVVEVRTIPSAPDVFGPPDPKLCPASGSCMSLLKP
jgi:hypothetical protein